MGFVFWFCWVQGMPLVSIGVSCVIVECAIVQLTGTGVGRMEA